MSIVLFADEAGLAVLRDCSFSPLAPVAVYDPDRFGDRLPEGLGAFRSLPHPTKDQRAAFVHRLAELDPKTGIIFSYSRILWKELLGVFPNGVYNIHFGKLPQYRGANTLQWSIINGEAATAATLHRVDQGIDTGPVIDEREVAIAPGDTALTVQRKLLDGARDLLDEWLPRLSAQPAEGVPQDEGRARTWPRRTPEDGKIDWAWPDETIRNLTRALVAPWPGAWYEDADGGKIVIDRDLTVDEVRELRRRVAP